MLTALVNYLRKIILVASLHVLLMVGHIFPAYFVATFATVSPHNTLCFIICWVIFKIHPYVISTFATTKPLC